MPSLNVLAALSILAAALVPTTAAAQGDTEAWLRTWSIPARVLTDEPFGVHYEWEHRGDEPWTNDTGWAVTPVHAEDAETWSIDAVLLRSGEEVLPGDRKIWAFSPRAPKTPGSYRFHWQLTQDGEPVGDIPEEATIEVVAPDAGLEPDPVFFRMHRGNVLVPEGRPTQLETEDGQSLLLLGKSGFALLSQRGPAGYLEEAREQGFSMVRVFLLTPDIVQDERFSGNFEQFETGWPWEQSAEDWTMDLPRNRYWNRLDTLMDQAAEKGMVVQLTLFTGPALTYFENPTVFDDTKKAYVTAIMERINERTDPRTGNVFRGRQGQAYIEVANEYDAPAPGPGPFPHEGIPAEFIEQVANFVIEEEARINEVGLEDVKRLVTVSSSSSDAPPFPDAAWNALHTVHLPKVDGWERRIYDLFLTLRAGGKPVMDDRSVGGGDLLAEALRDDDPVRHRVRAWAGVMAGGFVGYHSDYGIAAIKGDRPGVAAYRPLRTFWERLNHWELDPDTEFVVRSTAETTWGRASRSQYALYLLGLGEGGSVTVSLPQRGATVTRYEVRWFDPSAGTFLDRQWIDAGERTFDFPALEHDAALLITRLDANRTPGIRNLRPDCVPLDYGGNVTVVGDNFSPGIHMLVDGIGAVPLTYVDSQEATLQLARYLGEESQDQMDVYELVEGEFVVRARGSHGLFSGPTVMRVVEKAEMCEDDFEPDAGGQPGEDAGPVETDTGAPDTGDEADAGLDATGGDGDAATTPASGDDDGCSCATPGRGTGTGRPWSWLALGIVGLAWRRRVRRG